MKKEYFVIIGLISITKYDNCIDCEDNKKDPNRISKNESASINMNLGNGVVITDTITASKNICIGTTCVNEAKLKILDRGTVYLHNIYLMVAVHYEENIKKIV